ncbi:hypothetical protein GCM10023189_19160 [Nibrella saemangeumensis]|uniref:Carboxypeptidase regulatory-like domain-containing protein n=1 Tax=Nibrella saemangeumensis TaxID=1084526 RepID=A0ABP8MP33_9BACT
MLWTYRIQKTSGAANQQVREFIINLGPCVSQANVDAIAVYNKNGNAITDFTTRYSVSGGNTILTIDDLPGGNAPGDAIRIELTLDVNVDASANNVQALVSSPPNTLTATTSLLAPGCYHVEGNVQKQECNSAPTSFSGLSVTLASATNSYTTTTDAAGNYTFDHVVAAYDGTAGTSYTISIAPAGAAPQSQVIVVGPNSVTTGTSFTVTYPCPTNVCYQGEGYWFNGSGSDSWTSVTIDGATYTKDQLTAYTTLGSGPNNRNVAISFIRLIVAANLSGISDGSDLASTTCSGADYDALQALVVSWLSGTPLPTNDSLSALETKAIALEECLEGLPGCPK